MENIALLSVKVPYKQDTNSSRRRVRVYPMPKSKPSGANTTTELSITAKFLGAGTAACIGDLVTFPLDTAKVRLQVGTGPDFFVWILGDGMLEVCY